MDLLAEHRIRALQANPAWVTKAAAATIPGSQRRVKSQVDHMLEVSPSHF